MFNRCAKYSSSDSDSDETTLLPYKVIHECVHLNAMLSVLTLHEKQYSLYLAGAYV